MEPTPPSRTHAFLRRHPAIWLLLILVLALAASACLHFAADSNTVVYQAF